MEEEKILEDVIQPLQDRETEPKERIVKTEGDSNDGQEKCPMCGATDITLNVNTGKLRCNFCRHEFKPQKVSGMEEDITKLKGKVVGSGAQNIEADVNDIITLKCQSCGAEVVIDTQESAQARCHWCRNTLSINSKIPNGSVPDVVLPFALKREEAVAEIEKFVKQRAFFAHPKFKKEFTTENVMGVYFPYMLVDVNGHCEFKGQGEEEIRKYTQGEGDEKKTYYDAELYNVERKFDISIKELSIESSIDKLDITNKTKTNNIINSIMPFDTENCVKWSANYIKGFSSEKRDTNIESLENVVLTQAKDVAKFKINDTLNKYDRGVRWDKKEMDALGQQWKAAYLPVWLYSYRQKKGKDGLLHYIAVNARTKETMGSVPIHMPKLISISAVVEIIGILIMLFAFSGSDSDSGWKYALLLPGVLFFAAMYGRYRNSGARHDYENETFSEVRNMEEKDEFVRTEYRLETSKIDGANNKTLEGQLASSGLLDILKQ